MPDPPVRAVDDPIGLDQYRYVSTHAWWLGSVGTPDAVHAYLAEHVVAQWVPARPDRDWLLDHQVTRRVRWLTGSPEAAHEAGFDPRDGVLLGRFQAPYGDFHADQQGRRPGRRAQGWHTPTPAFLAGLSRDPEALLARLCADNPQGRYGGPFTAAAGALRTCLVPAELRTALLRALCALPAVTVVEDVADLDGRSCLGIVHDAGPTRTELLVDPADGQYAGERDTLRRDSRCGLRVGTMIGSTAVHTGIVDQLGALPG